MNTMKVVTRKAPRQLQAGGGNEPQEDTVRWGVSPNVNYHL